MTDPAATDVCVLLQRIHNILRSHPGDSAAWLASVCALCKTHDENLYRELNSKRMWGGAGSIANEALADNPGMEAWQWHMQIRELRELMIALGKHLQARGQAYPDIPSWLLAFNNWNQSDI